MAGEAPLATIAIPTFNRMELLRRAVAAARAQDYPALEILIVDNDSLDDTEQVARAMAKDDHRIRYVRQEENVGPVRNFITCLELAAGHYFMWLADDDWITPNYVGRCIQELERGHILAVGADHWDSANSAEALPPITALEPEPTTRILNYLRHVGYNVAAYGVARTADLRRQLPLPAYLGGDWVWVLMLLKRGTLQVVQDAEIHRSAGGASRNVSALSASLGVSPLRSVLPATALPFQVFLVMTTDPRLRCGRAWGQWGFAYRAARICWHSIQAQSEFELWYRGTRMHRALQPGVAMLRRITSQLRSHRLGQ